ncbi:MAG: T9SS type A sorting domain-containing protein [Bacteroidales bacterium]|nr:T9SS type A sorting domain-containing protein [Bacteroidales bacterium]
MVRKVVLAVLLISPLLTFGQEILCPLQFTSPNVVWSTKNTSAVELPFFDDFSSPRNSLSSTLWMNNQATVNTGYGQLPPTIGMATLDAMGADGQLYPQASTTPFPADTLLSRPINLQGLTIADSVVFSFFYLPGGGHGNRWELVGDAPDATDSLVLEVRSAQQISWQKAWSTPGISVDTLLAQTGETWQYVVLKIDNPLLLDSAFQFRFRNYCSLANDNKRGMRGNCDQWNIDYILVDKQRTTTAFPFPHDVAFVQPATPPLKYFRAMPWRQYTSADMAPHFDLVITNLYTSTLASIYDYYIINSHADTLYHYTGGYTNAPPFRPQHGYQSDSAHAHPPIAYAFPTMSAPTTYTILHSIKEGVGGDSYPQNDTMSTLQVFDDYYAYDDGSAENGFGLTSTASRMFLAYRFPLNFPDTIFAISIGFNRTIQQENETIPFYLTIWDDNNGRPGNAIYRDQEARRPLFASNDGLYRYELERPQAVSGTIYVGFEQSNNDFINLGFDRSFNSSTNIFYLTGTDWQQSILSGSLLMRPHLGRSTLGIAHPQTATIPQLHPTIASNSIFFSDILLHSQIQIFDLTGRQVISTIGSDNGIVVSHLPSGMYFARVQSTDKSFHLLKFIVQH